MALVLFSYLLTTTVNCNQLSCLSHFNACSVIITRPVVSVDVVNSVNVARFCEDMTNIVVPCIAEKMQVNKGDSLYGRATTLARCYNTTNKGALGVEVERQRFLKVTRLYLYACVYSNIIDMTRPRCFEFDAHVVIARSYIRSADFAASVIRPLSLSFSAISSRSVLKRSQMNKNAITGIAHWTMTISR
uniref:Gnk2-homologous domain-containing protein n=1 Tax=Ascaris lumbricoides TaxID=6252 RepID=A0A0M3HTV8_ASCLU